MKKEKKAGVLLSQLILGYSFLSLLLGEFFYAILKSVHEINGVSHYAIKSVGDQSIEISLILLLLFVMLLVVGVGIVSMLFTYDIFKKKTSCFDLSLENIDSSGLKSMALILFLILPIAAMLNILYWGLNLSVILIILSLSVLVLVHSLSLWVMVRKNKQIETMGI